MKNLSEATRFSILKEAIELAKFQYGTSGESIEVICSRILKYYHTLAMLVIDPD